jgi:hypothetical protein
VLEFADRHVQRTGGLERGQLFDQAQREHLALPGLQGFDLGGGADVQRQPAHLGGQAAHHAAFRTA